MSAPVAARPLRKAVILATLFAVALIVVPFWFWYDTWFGRRLSDSQIEQFLHEPDKPRRAQQAVVQIGERMARSDATVPRWFLRLVELSSHQSAELRETIAWIMGQERAYEPFRARLTEMLNDASPIARRNAALSLAARGDPAGRPVLVAMLGHSTLASSADGTLKYRLKTGDFVNPGTLVARVGGSEVRAELPGEVRGFLAPDGSQVRTGQALAEISPDESHVWEALRALYLVGTRDDRESVRRWIRPPSGVSTKVPEQAALTLRRLESRR